MISKRQMQMKNDALTCHIYAKTFNVIRSEYLFEMLFNFDLFENDITIHHKIYLN